MCKKDKGVASQESSSVDVAPKALESRTRTTYEFVLSGSVDDISREKAEAIINHLRTITGDASLTVVKIEEGSILFELEGSEEGFRILEALQRDGKLTEVLGLRIKRMSHLGSPSSKNENPIEFFFLTLIKMRIFVMSWQRI